MACAVDSTAKNDVRKPINSNQRRISCIRWTVRSSLPNLRICDSTEAIGGMENCGDTVCQSQKMTPVSVCCNRYGKKLEDALPTAGKQVGAGVS
ncbi:hypothetical protein Zmor_007404 [Zophobas morio]|uniref:Uncharacterized protein n=1 Tax=Zophobas morio TaxID=2755281 RepID=A0AA38MM32_9CUCU|nr:hypothetical protein Zmor_007404 [Zophobas morio]